DRTPEGTRNAPECWRQLAKFLRPSWLRIISRHRPRNFLLPGCVLLGAGALTSFRLKGRGTRTASERIPGTQIRNGEKVAGTTCDRDEPVCTVLVTTGHQ